MSPRRLPLHADIVASQLPLVPWGPTQVAPAGFTRKTLAVATHLTCMGLFAWLVVWPVASPLASGELAREFKPVLQAVAAWSPWKADR